MALVEGRIGDENTPGTGMIDIPMHKWKDMERREFGSVVCACEGLPAVTKYKCLRQWHVPATGAMAHQGRDRWFSLLQLRILSGRTHQIRVHLAFIGHPLIGDMKYNTRHFELDSAFIPRIFLHCMRMEFKEFDGSLFVASSDLAPDLQAALTRIDAMSDKKSCDAAGTIPGLAKILAESKKDHEPPFVPEPPGAVERFDNWSLPYRCLNCKSVEEATCFKMQRRDKTAMHWKLLRKTNPLEPG